MTDQVAKMFMKEARDAVGSLKPEAGSVAKGDTRFVPPASPPDADEESLSGWGFADTKFVVQPNESVVLTGKRYNISNVELPALIPWISKMLAAPLGYGNRNEPQYPPQIPEAQRSAELEKALEGFLRADQITREARVRLRHGHGHTGAEIYAINYGKLPRIPDVVVYPASHEEVVKLTEAAKKHDACLIPFGGGTNVTDALRLPLNEKRVVVAVDMRRMNKVLWIDVVNRMACIEAGATGRHLADELKKHGMTMGHEPDSMEFSTLGGWIATNASGMKKNRYGNIEDLVLDMTVVTPHGVVARPATGQAGPRESIGANPVQFMFGSEGNYGIVTNAVVKLTALPEVQRYGSVVFPNLETGLAFLYDLQMSGAIPASVRLMDNTQFHFGQALKPETKGRRAKAKSNLERIFVTQVKGFDPFEMTVATLVFEGSADEVEYQEKSVYKLAKKHRGLKGGATNGERGYQLTFGIAYIRDLTFQHWAIAESFETSVPWSRAHEVYEAVRRSVHEEHARRKLPGKPFFTGRFTQIYPTGVAIYFYMGFYTKGVKDPVAEYAGMENAARAAILKAGGSLSHHHGVGKIRQAFLKDIYSEGALRFSRDVKTAVDPSNVFGAANHGVLGDVQIDEGNQHG